ncbi:hypothetical protein [Paracoccus sp. Ld10]|uniref:hypothetical protein n=1 Tax=Paracoccus sp. Ld10 TaxID=649158 RepID=UPI003862E875
MKQPDFALWIGVVSHINECGQITAITVMVLATLDIVFRPEALAARSLRPTPSVWRLSRWR